MGIEIQAYPNGVKLNQWVTFKFENQVQAFVIGISAFTFSYGQDTDHWVRNFSLKLLPGTPSLTGVVGNAVTVVINAQFQDDSDHTLNYDYSLVCPVCVAVTGVADSNTVMTNVTGISNETSAQVDLPGTSGFSVVTAFLSGFTLDFSNSDHQVLGANAGCGITYNQALGQVSSSADLYDAKGNHVNTATVDAGVIASVDSAPGFAIRQVSGQTGGLVAVDFPELTSISNAVVLMQSWTVKYDSVHNVQWISAGSYAAPTISGNTVTVQSLFAHIQDNSGHTEDDSESSVTAFVLAIP